MERSGRLRLKVRSIKMCFKRSKRGRRDGSSG